MTLLIYLTIFGVLIKETISQTSYEVKLKGDGKVEDGKLTFTLVKNKETDDDLPEVEGVEIKLVDSKTNDITSTCKTSDDKKELKCTAPVTEPISAPITTKENNAKGKDKDGNDITLNFNNEDGQNKLEVLKESDPDDPNEIVVTEYKPIDDEQPKDDGTFTFYVNTKEDLPDDIEDVKVTPKVNGTDKEATCTKDTDDKKKLKCTLNGVTKYDKIEIKDDTDGKPPIKFGDGSKYTPKNKDGGADGKELPTGNNDGTSAGKATAAKGVNKVDRNQLGAPGVLGIVLAALAGLIGLGLCLSCCNNIPPVPTPIVSEAVQPIIIPESVVPQQPIVIDSAHAVVPSAMPQPLPTPILPPPRPVIPVMPQPVVVPVVQPAQVAVIQPTPFVDQVVETPVVEPVVTDLVQPVVQDMGIINQPYVDQGLVGDFDQPIFTTGEQF